jgi:hydroxyacylglutathione hydrolase
MNQSPDAEFDPSRADRVGGTSDAVRSLLAPNPGPMTLDGTRTFIVGRRRPVVIDPGPDDERHVRAIVDALGGASLLAILLTHTHLDHAGAAPMLAEATGALVHGARGSLNALRNLPLEPLAEGDEIETDAGIVRVIETPGHAPEHVAFHLPETGELFVGDTFMGVGDTTLVSPPEGDLAAYLRTLDRVEALAPSILHPAHGPAIRDPAEAVARYRKHRVERIGQVVHALRRAGPSRADELVDAVYGPALDPRLRGAAEGSLGAILGYLLAEGLAREVDAGLYTTTDSETG